MANMSCWEKFCDMVGVGCCIDEDEFKQRPLAEVVQNDQRHCTDVPCLLLLFCVFFFQFYLIFYAAGNGADPDYLLHGWNYKGELCDSSNSEGKYNAWPDLNNTYKVRICVSSCTQTTEAANNSQMIAYYQSESFLNAWCIPTSAALANMSSADYDFSSSQETYERAVANLDTAKWLILASAFLAVGIAFTYLKLVACMARIIIWLTIILLFVGGFFITYFLIDDGMSNIQSSETEDTGKIELGVGICCAILLTLLLLSMMWCRKRIDLAIEMLHEAAHAIRDMKSTILFPVLYSVVGMAYIAFWICVALYIYSAKIEKSKSMPTPRLAKVLGSEDYKYYEFDTSMQDALLYHCICLLYIMQVIIYFGFMVLAGVIADWYFSQWDMEKKHKLRGDGPAELAHAPLCESLWRVFRYHIGSLAFGSALITIIRVIRACVTYIEKKTKAAENPLSKCLFCCAQCCLKCFECVLDKISKEGFIFTTIYGTGFCYSSFQALKLLWNNIGRATVVQGVSKYMELFGRLGVACMTTGICYLYMNYDTYFIDNLTSTIFPGTVIFVLSYLIASLFMMVFEVGVDTIFLCFLVDETVHGTPRFASDKMLNMAALHYSNEPDSQQSGYQPANTNARGGTGRGSTGPRV